MTRAMQQQANGNGRRPLDLYPTAAAVTRAFLSIEDVGGTVVVEPCAGPGDMARVLEADGRFRFVITNDINPHHGCDFTGDATKRSAEVWQGQTDWVICNPPFNVAHLILPIALDVAQVGVAFLLRITYAEPARNRGDWLAEHADQMTRFMPLNPRPSFTGDGNTDSTTVAWFVWRKGWSWDEMGVARPFVFIRDWNLTGSDAVKEKSKIF